MEEISMMAKPGTTQGLNTKRVKNTHGGESDNLQESLRYTGRSCSRFRYQLVSPSLENNPYLLFGALLAFLFPLSQ